MHVATASAAATAAEKLSPAEEVDKVSANVSPNAVDPGALGAGTLGAGSTSPKLVYGTDEVPETHGELTVFRRSFFSFPRRF